MASIQHVKRMSTVIGSNVILPCRAPSGSPMIWRHSESNITQQFDIFNGRSVDPNYVDRMAIIVDETAGDYNLSLQNVQLNDSGFYICTDVHSSYINLTLLHVHGS